MNNLTKLNLDEYKPLRDVVFENLREAIVQGKLKPGQRLMEVQLAEQLGVSRTPFLGSITTNPSSSNFLIASLTGVLLTPNCSAN